MRRGSLLDRKESGSVSLWLIIFTLTTFVLLAFIVDTGQYMNARERAADIAEQAARAGADQVSPASLYSGGPINIPRGPACTAAQDLVDSYKGGVLASGEASATNMPYCEPEGPTVTVDVTVTVTPLIPVIFGDFTTGARETATLECGNAVRETGAC